MIKILENNILKLGLVMFLFFLIGIIQVRVFYPPGQLIVDHDMMFHLNRIYGLAEAIRVGQFPFYISPVFLGGYGYASNWFYSDLFLLPASILVLIDFELVPMFKMFLILITTLTGLSMYYCASKISKNNFIGLLAAIIYVLSHYRFYNVFIRSAMGEVIAYIFLPFVLYGIYELIFKDKKKWYILTFSFTALLFTHVISTVIAFIFVVVFCIINYKAFMEEPSRLGYLIVSGLVSLFTAAFFLFPFLEQTLAHTYHFQEYPIFHTHLTSIPLSGIFRGLFLNPIYRNELFFIGLGPTMLISLTLIFLFLKKEKHIIKFANCLTILSLFFIFMVSNLFPWQSLSFLNFIQFPWRLYGLISLLLSMSAAIYVVELKLRKLYNCIIIAGVIVVSIAFSLIGPMNMGINDRFAYFTKESVMTTRNSFQIGGGNEYLPISLTPGYILHRHSVMSVGYNPEITTIYGLHQTGNTLTITFTSGETDVFEVPLIYYPGYRAFLNGNVINIQQGYNALILIEVEATRNGELIIIYHGTTIQRISLAASLFSCVIYSCIYALFE